MGRGNNDTSTLPARRERLQLVRDPDTLGYPQGSLIVLCATPGAGKSTFARRAFPDAVLISSDECRAQAFNSAGSWDQAASGAAFKMAFRRARKALEQGKTVVFDSTAARQSDRNEVVKLGRESGASVHFLGFDCPIDVCRERNRLRGLTDPMREVPDAAIDRIHALVAKAFEDVPSEDFDSATVLSVEGQDKLAPADHAGEPQLARVTEGDQKTLESWMASADPVAQVRAAAANGELERLLPEVAETIGYDQKSPYHDLTLFEHIMAVLGHISTLSDDPDLRWAALLHDIGKPASRWFDEKGIGRYYVNPELRKEDHAVIGARMAEQVCLRFGLAPERVRRIVTLVRHHMFTKLETVKAAGKFEQRVGSAYVEDLFKLREADHAGKPDAVANTDLMRDLVERAREQALAKPAEAVKVKLALTGAELISALELERGPTVGRLIARLNERVTAEPNLNERSRLLEIAREEAEALSA